MSGGAATASCFEDDRGGWAALLVPETLKVSRTGTPRRGANISQNISQNISHIISESQMPAPTPGQAEHTLGSARIPSAARRQVPRHDAFISPSVNGRWAFQQGHAAGVGIYARQGGHPRTLVFTEAKTKIRTF